MRLPEAFRSLSRLSSALSAKASALRPTLLNLCTTCLRNFFFTTCCILLLINIALLIYSTRNQICDLIAVIERSSMTSYHCLDRNQRTISLIFRCLLSVFDFQGTNLRSKVLRNSNEETCTLSGLSPVLCGTLEVVWSLAVIVAFSFNWAEEDSNFRPHAYQACALTG